jgi:uncharacterized protein YndB with AHSA1/START domain
MVDIVHRVGVKAPLDQVYRALATPEGIAGWWTTDTQGDSKAGGMLKTVFTAGGKVLGGFDIKVLELEPGKRVLWQVVEGPAEWIGTKISFDLKQEDDFPSSCSSIRAGRSRWSSCTTAPRSGRLS